MPPIGAECFKKFKETQPNWLELLHTCNDLNKSEKTLTTIQTQNRQFQAHVATLKTLALTASSSSGFGTLIVTVGNCIHEDAGLCNVYVSPGAEGVSVISTTYDVHYSNFFCFWFLEHFHIDDDMYSRLFRNHIWYEPILELNNMFTDPLTVTSLHSNLRTVLSRSLRSHLKLFHSWPIENHDQKQLQSSSWYIFFCIHIFSTTVTNMTTDDVKAENLPTGNLIWKTLPEYFIIYNDLY